MKLIVIRFQCTSEVNRIECTTESHQMHIDCVHMAQQVSRFEVNSGEC